MARRRGALTGRANGEDKTRNMKRVTKNIFINASVAGGLCSFDSEI